jgi:hypothetical protein
MHANSSVSSTRSLLTPPLPLLEYYIVLRSTPQSTASTTTSVKRTSSSNSIGVCACICLFVCLYLYLSIDMVRVLIDEAIFYGIMSSNHPELMHSYPNPMLDSMPSAREYAAEKAQLALNITCPGLHYPDVLAPWGVSESADGVNADAGLNSNGPFSTMPGALLSVCLSVCPSSYDQPCAKQIEYRPILTLLSDHIYDANVCARVCVRVWQSSGSGSMGIDRT